MLHHTIIACLPEGMRRLMFSLSCSSSKAANVPKPVTSGIASSQIRIHLSRRPVDEMQNFCLCGPACPRSGWAPEPPALFVLIWFPGYCRFVLFVLLLL